MSDDQNYTKLNVFLPVSETQATQLIDAHLSITQGPTEGTGLLLPKSFDHYSDQPIGVDLCPGHVDGKPGLWIRDSFGQANTEYVGALIQHHAQMAGIQTPIAFQYGDRQAGMDVGDYGGGAMVVTSTTIEAITTSGWIDETVAKLQGEQTLVMDAGMQYAADLESSDL